MVELTCESCAVPFKKKLALYDAALRRGQTRFFCSPACASAAHRTAEVSATCEACGKEFARRRGDLKRSDHVFCSTACSNRARTRKSWAKTVPCVECGDVVRQSDRRKLGMCLACYKAQVEKRTKGELFATRANWQSARSTIQTCARRKFLRAYPNPSCDAWVEQGRRCGYAKHVEVAHRRDVADFPASALIGEINAVSNLVGLCPTHHWEFDHNELEYELP